MPIVRASQSISRRHMVDTYQSRSNDRTNQEYCHPLDTQPYRVLEPRARIIRVRFEIRQSSTHSMSRLVSTQTIARARFLSLSLSLSVFSPCIVHGADVPLNLSPPCWLAVAEIPLVGKSNNALSRYNQHDWPRVLVRHHRGRGRERERERERERLYSPSNCSLYVTRTRSPLREYTGDSGSQYLIA